jgi:hypothetical protein
VGDGCVTALELSAADYHEGHDDQPRLSASIAHILCSRSPLHAWTAHPRLNPLYERKEEDKFDVGKAAHSILLEGDDVIYVVHEDSWRKNVAKEARDYARSLGKVPLLAAARDEVMAMVDAVREQLAAHSAEPPLFSDGKPEQTLLWEEGGVLCKARLDWLRNDLAAVDDLKTSAQSAAPDAWRKRLFNTGAHIQAYVYTRAVEVVHGVKPTFRWAVAETQPPYGLTVSEPGGDILAAGQSDFEYALGVWRSCMESGEWPGYDPVVTRLEAPSWELDRRVAREEWAAA